MAARKDLRHQLRRRLRHIIFGVDTPSGKAFDVGLLWAILLSVAVVLLESVPNIRLEYGAPLRIAEWVFTVLFSIEYGVRLWIAPRRLAYAFSFYGLVDLLAILPSYVSAVLAGTQSLAVVRALRLMRVFRVLKLVGHLREFHALSRALKASRPKIVVFLTGVLSVAITFGSVMYLIEGDDAGFTSIPTSIYWAVVTMTTVGYGDIAPRTALGQFVALCLMVLGYAIIAVPTGIVSAELARSDFPHLSARRCPQCQRRTLGPRDSFCSRCGHQVTEPVRRRRNSEFRTGVSSSAGRTG